MTILEVLRVMGQGANAQFRFGNRKPGSTTPLLFELADKHLKDCERMYVSLPSFYRLSRMENASILSKIIIYLINYQSNISNKIMFGENYLMMNFFLNNRRTI